MQCLKTCWIALRQVFFLWDASFDDIVKLLKNPAALPQTAPAHAQCFGYWNPFCCRPESFTFDFFSSHSSYISFIFGFVTIRIYMTFTIILYSCSRLCTMHAQMYKVGENVTGSTEHPCALPGELLPCYAQESRTDHSAFHSAN